jgi:type I phosphodiesterase/nucleotide pyrophosphatase
VREVAFAAVVFAATIAALTHRGSRLAAAWGAAWGIAAGFWLIAPLLRNVHYLQPTTLQHWIVLNGFLLVAFAAWGGGLSLVAASPCAFVWLSSRREFRNPVWAYAIWAAAWLPIMYLSVSALIDWSNMHTRPSLATYASAFRPVVAPYVLIILVLLLVYRLRAAQGWDRRGRVLAAIVAAAGAAGCVAAPLASAVGITPRPVHVDVPKLVAARAQPPRPPLLVIGLDGGTWRVLRPLMDRGRAPTLAKLAAAGIQGVVPGVRPPYWSSPAWAAISTGHTADEDRVHEDLAAEVPGLPPYELPLQLNPALNPMFAIEYGLAGAHILEPIPTPRTRLTWPPVWERLSNAGVVTAVIRFPFTYPAAGRADYVVSNRIATDLWGALGVRRGDRDKLIAPPSDAAKWLPWFEDTAVDERLVAEVLPQSDWPKPPDAYMAPIDVLKKELDIRHDVQEVSKAIVHKHRDIEVLMKYIGTFDPLCHAFWQYRFPEDFPDDPPAAADVAVLGPILDRYVETFDRNLAQLIAAFPSPPNVVIVSDHGEGPATTFRTVWRAEHVPPGIFLAGGPDVPHTAEMIEVSYYDIVPTILDLRGFVQPPDLVGHSVVDAIRSGAAGQ